MYAFAAIALISALVSGYGVREYMSGQLLQCEMAIERGNSQAEVMLEVSKRKVSEAEAEAEKSNQQLQASYESNIATVNTYFDKLRQSQRATSHSNPMPSCESAGTFTATTTEFAETAYRLEAYANSCRQFINDNCGIAQ